MKETEMQVNAERQRAGAGLAPARGNREGCPYDTHSLFSGPIFVVTTLMRLVPVAALLALMALALLHVTVWHTNMAKAQGQDGTNTTLADQIGVRLVCQCGCASILVNCVHQECMSRDQMMKAVNTQLAQGKTPDQIVQAFVQTYGEQVLAEPPKKGFNLTAWIAPFVGLILGAFLVVLLLRAWVFQGRLAETSESVDPVPVEDEYLRRVDQEIKETP